MKQRTIICSNPECKEEINNYISSKRKFCSDKCRNRFGFLHRKEKNKEMNLYFTKLKALENFFNHLHEFDINRISKEDFDKSLFKNFILPSMENKNIDGNIIKGSTVGNIFLEALKIKDQEWYVFYKIK